MDSIVLALAGDVMTGRGIDQALAHPGDPALHESFVRDARDYVRLAEEANGPVARPIAPAGLWGALREELATLRPHAAIANLETAVTDAGTPWPGKGIHYRMNPANIDCLRESGFSAWALANNHLLDWGRRGLADTLDALRRAGLPCAGAGADLQHALAPAPLPLPGGGRVLLFSFAEAHSGVPLDWAAGPRTSGIALLDTPGAREAARVTGIVRSIRTRGDIVIVSVHWGGNWGFDIDASRRDFAHALIDSGAADVVHGHSSHHPLPIEVHRGKPVLYGCGDLMNDYEGIGMQGSLRSDLPCLYELTLAADTQVLAALRIVPMRLRRFRLERADARGRDWLRSLFRERGKPFGTDVEDTPDGNFLLRWPP